MKKTLLLFIPLLIPLICIAQKRFTEGVLSYAVLMEKNKEQTQLTKVGSYTFTIKNNYFRKEIKMDGGYENIILQTPATHYSLRTVGPNNYAIEINEQEQKQKNAAYSRYAIADKAGNKTIAGFKGQEAAIQYSDTNVATLYYNKKLTIDTAVIFDRLGNTNFIPLMIEYKNLGGVTLFFRLEKVQPKPIDNALFLLPSDYRIITDDEFRAMTD